MAKRSSVNNISLTYDHAEAMYQLKEFLKTWGWSVKGTGDGSSVWSNYPTHDPPTDYITSRTVMNTLRAWYRIQDPGGRREFVVQRGSTTGQYRIKYSALDKFTGGSPSATQTPTASDDGTAVTPSPSLLLGGGTDASPSYAALFDSTAGAGNRSYHHMVCYDDAVNGVYGFYSFAHGVAGLPGATLAHTFICDPLAEDGCASADPDPCIVLASGSPFALRNDMIVKAWYRMNLSGEAVKTYNACKFYRGGYVFYPGYAGLNPYDGKDGGVPIPWGRTYYDESGVAIDLKGFAGRLRWRGANRNYPDVVDLSGDARVYMIDVLLPWPSSVEPMV